MLQTILSISGKPGLFRLVSRGKNNLVVETLDSARKVRDKEQGKVCSLNWRKASGTELFSYFGEVLPTFDRDRVHSSDIKKLLQWYDLLVANGISDFEESMKPTDGDNVDDRQ